MASVTRRANVTNTGSASNNMFVPQIYEYHAGELIESGMPVYFNGTDKKWYKANGTAANAAAVVVGFASHTAKPGQPLTVYGKGAKFGGFSGLTPMAKLYLDTVAGGLNTAATTGGTAAIALAVTSEKIVTIGGEF